MESDLLQAFQEELICFICMSFLTDPVTISCGHSFCRACLQLCREDSELPVHCPTCREPSQQKYLRTNIVLKKLVSIVRQASLMEYLSSEEHQCVTHKETKGIFCMENRIYLCRLCSDSHEHRGHRHCSIEAAAEAQMESFVKFKHRRMQWSRIKYIPNITDNVSCFLQNFLIMREDMIRIEYRKWHAVPNEQENQHIVCMNNEGTCILEKFRESEAMMIQKRKELREMYQELKAMSQESYVVLLQQDLDDIFRRISSISPSQGDSGMFPEPSLLHSLPGLWIAAHPFISNLAVFHCKKNLFNVMRRFNFRPQHQDTSVDPDGIYLASWGSQSFTSGKYYWEVDLKDTWDWAVGVCTNSWLRNTGQVVETEGAFLLFCVKEGNRYSLLTTNPVFHHFIEKPLGRVGVFLDCEDGCLSFLNIAKSSFIYKYPNGTFAEPVWPFFSSGQIKP
ncbi:Tripartite motif-containing protein 43C [Lemmus lemmus]